jgi:hypothetical protein
MASPALLMTALRTCYADSDVCGEHHVLGVVGAVADGKRSPYVNCA